MRRKPGHASVEEHPKGSGKWRVRVRKGKGFKVLASGLSEQRAYALADAQAQVRAVAQLREGVTFEQFGVGFMARRAEQGVRGVRKDELRWNKHVAAAPIGKLAVASLLRSDVVEWRDKLQGKHRSKLKLLNLLRVALDEAVERGLLDANPAREVKLHKSGAARSTDDLEGILTPAEQGALIKAVRLRDRPAVVFALFTGLRLSEQWRLDWSDLTPEAVIVSKSVGGDPAKSGKVREVPLLPGALQAVQVQRAFGRKGPIVFVGARGARRTDTKSPLSWPRWVKAAGIKRHVTWHDLRHTCATALLAGWWGRKWSLDEVCKMLGHSSIAVTERYARKLNETLRLAVAGTSGPAFPMFPQGNKKELTVGKSSGSRAFVKHRSSVQVRQSAPVLTSRGREQRGNSDGAQSLHWLRGTGVAT
jgi:integrase